MSKQTATDWLEMEFIKLEKTIGVNHKMYELIEQAKKIDEQNIKKAYRQGYNNAYFNNPIAAIEYYNETFKQK